jgi:hypothetical protein
MRCETICGAAYSRCSFLTTFVTYRSHPASTARQLVKVRCCIDLKFAGVPCWHVLFMSRTGCRVDPALVWRGVDLSGA